MTTRIRVQCLGPLDVLIIGSHSLPPDGVRLTPGSSTELTLSHDNGTCIMEAEPIIHAPVPSVADYDKVVAAETAALLTQHTPEPVPTPAPEPFTAGGGGDFGGAGATGSWEAPPTPSPAPSEAPAEPPAPAPTPSWE